MSERIEVRWGGEWVRPEQWTLKEKDKRTVIAYLETRTGVWKHIHFKNYVFRDKVWRYV